MGWSWQIPLRSLAETRAFMPTTTRETLRRKPSTHAAVIALLDIFPLGYPSMVRIINTSAVLDSGCEFWRPLRRGVSSNILKIRVGHTNWPHQLATQTIQAPQSLSVGSSTLFCFLHLCRNSPRQINLETVEARRSSRDESMAFPTSVCDACHCLCSPTGKIAIL